MVLEKYRYRRVEVENTTYTKVNLLEIFPRLDPKISFLAEQYICEFTTSLNGIGIVLNGVQSALMRMAQPTDRIDIVRNRFAKMFEDEKGVEGMGKRKRKFYGLLGDSTSKSVNPKKLAEKLAGVGPTDFDTKAGKLTLLNDTDRERIKTIFFQTSYNLFGNSSSITQDENGRVFQTHTLEDEIEIVVSYGPVATNNKIRSGEIKIIQDGETKFLFHTGLYSHSLRDEREDKRAGHSVSRKGNVAVTLKCTKNGLYVVSKDIDELRKVLKFPDYYEKTEIDTNDIDKELERAFRAIRTNMFFLGGHDNQDFFQRAFTEDRGWDIIEKIVSEMRRVVYSTNGYRDNLKKIPIPLQELLIKEIALMFEINPIYTLLTSARTGFLRLLPYFHNAPPGFELKLLANNAFNIKLVQDPRVPAQRSSPTYSQFNIRTITEQAEAWEEVGDEVSGLKLFYLALNGKSRGDETDDFMDLVAWNELFDQDLGMLSFSTQSQWNDKMYGRSIPVLDPTHLEIVYSDSTIPVTIGETKIEQTSFSEERLILIKTEIILRLQAIYAKGQHVINVDRFCIEILKSCDETYTTLKLNAIQRLLFESGLLLRAGSLIRQNEDDITINPRLGIFTPPAVLLDLKQQIIQDALSPTDRRLKLYALAIPILTSAMTQLRTIPIPLINCLTFKGGNPISIQEWAKNFSDRFVGYLINKGLANADILALFNDEAQSQVVAMILY